MVSVAAVDLNALIDDITDGLRRIDLHDGALDRIFFEGGQFRVAHHPHYTPVHRLDGENAYRHLGKFVLDRAEFCDRRPECFPLLGISEAGGQNVLRCTRGEWPDLEPSDVQHVERDDVAAADLSERILYRNLDVIEKQRGSRTPVKAHLFL